jgi:adenosine deaminase
MNPSPADNIQKDIVFHVCPSTHMTEVLQDFASHPFQARPESFIRNIKISPASEEGPTKMKPR